MGRRGVKTLPLYGLAYEDVVARSVRVMQGTFLMAFDTRLTRA